MPLIETTTGSLFFADHRAAESPYPPVVLVHGAGGSHLDWPPQLRRLPKASVIAVDLPGHGKSPGPGRNSVSAYAADIIALLDLLKIPQAIIAGHSMGGAIAQTMALDHTGRVAGLILVGTGARLRVHPDILQRFLAEPEAIAALFKDWMWGENAPDSLRQTGYEQLLKTPPEVTHGDYHACNVFDVMERLGQITAPTLIIGGTADKMTPLKYAAHLQTHIPNSQLVTVEGGGHMMALEQPELVAQAIQDWLTSRCV